MRALSLSLPLLSLSLCRLEWAHLHSGDVVVRPQNIGPAVVMPFKSCTQQCNILILKMCNRDLCVAIRQPLRHHRHCIYPRTHSHTSSHTHSPGVVVTHYKPATNRKKKRKVCFERAGITCMKPTWCHDSPRGCRQTHPSKPHWSRNISVSRPLLPHVGTPFTLL